LVKFVAGQGFSSTFGWTPLACAAANATLDVMEEEGLPARAKELGSRAVERLRPLVDGVEHVADVRGYGLEMGIELTDESRNPLPAEEMMKLTRKLLTRGVFAEPSAYTSTLLIMPPLSIPEEQFDRALDIVAEAISEMELKRTAKDS
jgi:4-aminobutyrate aminotransferase